MRIEVQRENSSEAIVYEQVINAYVKGPFYCILFTNSQGNRVTHKFPWMQLFRVIEDYPESKR